MNIIVAVSANLKSIIKVMNKISVIGVNRYIESVFSGSGYASST
jgi:hypothetical protein